MLLTWCRGQSDPRRTGCAAVAAVTGAVECLTPSLPDDITPYLAASLIFALNRANDADITALSMSEDQIAAIHLCTQETVLYRRVNEALRLRHREAAKPFFPFVKLLLSALHRLPLTTAVVWRGVNRNLLPTYASMEGKLIVWWGSAAARVR